jgi:hypothetical protein
VCRPACVAVAVKPPACTRVHARVGRRKVLPLARHTQLNRSSFRVLLSCARRVEVSSCALHASSPSLPSRSSRWLAHAHTHGGKPSPLGALSHTRAHPGALMRRCEHAGNLNATPPLWCFTVVRATPRKPTKSPPLTMLSSIEGAQGRVVAFSIPPGARRRGSPFGIHTRAPA